MKFDLENIMQQAQKMQSEVERVRKEAESKTVEAESGGGMVKVTMSGNHRLTKISISKDLVNSDDLEMLEDLVVAAVNKASQEATAMIEREMGSLSGIMPNIPGMNFNI